MRTGKPADVPLRRSPPDISAVLLRSLTDRWQVFAAQAVLSRRHPTEKAIHDLRVATRRLIATLDILRTILPEGPPSKIRKQLKRHLKAFSALRDLQVQMIAVRRLVTRFPSLRPFLTALVVRERLLLKQARREILVIRMDAMERVLATVEQQLGALLADPVMRDASRQVVLGALGQAFSRAATLKAGAMSGKTNRIHRFRITFKRFRYAVEALQPLLPGVKQQMLKAMNRYQTRMGDIQDIEVLIGSVNSFARRHSRSAPVQFLRLKEHLLNRRKELIAQFIASANELDQFWRDLFTSAT
jgi:CHAD domain-containing protein